MALLNVMKQQNLENSTNFVASLLQCANMILEQNVIQTICNVVPISDTLKTLVETRNIAEQAQVTINVNLFRYNILNLVHCKANIPPHCMFIDEMSSGYTMDRTNHTHRSRRHGSQSRSSTFTA